MDTEELLKSLNANKVDFIVIGATAFPVYGYARATLDIDIFVRADMENIVKLKKALQRFGYDLSEVSHEDLLKKKLLIRQYLVETDIHPYVKGVTFEAVWKNKISSKFGDTEVNFPCLDDMIRMKKAAGRAKDLDDLKYLTRIKSGKKRS
jgi:predicted nucleotidyltransferase